MQTQFALGGRNDLVSRHGDGERPVVEAASCSINCPVLIANRRVPSILATVCFKIASGMPTDGKTCMQSPQTSAVRKLKLRSCLSEQKSNRQPLGA